MKQVLKRINSLSSCSHRDEAAAREFITIGDDIFAVAHSPKEMAKAMRMKGANVTGYVLSHRMQNLPTN